MSRVLPYLAFAVMLLSSYTAYSQGEIKPIMEQYAPTPKALEQSRYGEISMNHNSGSLGLEIPIGSYTDQDFDIPISLSYSNSGFKPMRPSGEAGLGWSLIAGGSITREIIGLDDFSPDGGYRSYSSNFSPSSIYEIDHSVTVRNDGQPSIDQNAHETTSDIYHFSFPGHYGSFIIDNYGNFAPYATSGEKGTYDITYDGYSGYFTIVTSDGMVWRFGSTYTSREIMLKQNGIQENYGHELTVDNEDLPVVTWLLDRIDAPDGRYAQFTYTSTRSNYNSIPSEGNDIITTFSRGQNKVNNSTKYKFASLVYTSYLTGISVYEASGTSKTVASFNWERKNYLEINGNEPFDYRKMIVKTRRLTGVTLSEGTTTLRTATLTYDDSRNRPLLTSVSIPVYGTWAFEYNLPSGNSNFPGQLSNAVDFWGYYNGNTSNSETLIAPTTVNAISLNEVLNTYDMDPDADYSVVGTLKKVVWPTGGSSTITYESHSASKMLLRRRYPSLTPIPEPDDRSFINAFIVSLENVAAILHNNLCGGVRVKKIEDNSVVDGSFERTFTYTDESGKNSGIIQEFNRYYAGKVGNRDFMNPFLMFPGNGFDANHIAYTSVVETLSDGTSIRTNYTSWKDNPDEYSSYSYQHNTTPSGYGDTYDIFIDNIQREADSRAYRRGKLLKSIMKDSNGNKIREDIYSYEDSDNTYAAYIVESGHYYWSARRFLCDRLTTSVETIFYPSPGQSIHSTKSYEYDYYGRLSQTRETDSDGAVYRTEYSYLNSTVQPSLVSCVEHKVKPAGSSVTYNTEKTDYTYSHSGDLWYRTSEARTLYNAAGTGTVADNTFYSWQDSYGHPRQVIVNQDTTAIVWGHKGRYPVAIVKNCKYSSLPATLKNTLTGNLTDTNIKTLYELQGTEVHAYSWLPSVGIAREIGPSGRSITYEYDSLKRLSAIKDASETVLQGFSYGNTQYSSGVSLRYTETAVNTGSAFRSEKSIYDGLGREWVNAIAPSGSANSAYLMSFCKHDGLSRKTRDYLPFTSTGLDLDFLDTLQRLYWGVQAGYEEGYHAFSSTSYSGGPLALPTQETLPGKAIHDADKHTTIVRKINSLNEVPLIINNESSLTASVAGYYSPGALLKTETFTPDGDSLFVYSTAGGREVLRRAVSGSTMLDTYNVQDRFGRPVCIITPMLGETIRNAAASGTAVTIYFESDDIKKGVYETEYDNKGNIKSFRSPGAEKDEKKYNTSHRLINHTPSTSSQLEHPLYVEHQYDNLGRETGTTLYRSALISFNDPLSRDSENRQPPFLFEDVLLGTLTSRVYGQSTSVDCIDNDTPGTPYASIPSNLAFAARTGIVSSADPHVTGELILERQWPLVTPMKDMNPHPGFGQIQWEYGDGMLGSTPASTAYYYDSHGRESQCVTSWPDGSLSRTSTSYDLEGNVLALLEEHTPAGTSSANDWTWTENSYDTRGHLLTSSVWVGKGAVPSKSAATLSYTQSHTYNGIGRHTGSSISCSGHTITESIANTVQGWTSSLSYSVDDILSFRENLAYWSPAHSGIQARYGGSISEATSLHRGYPSRTEGYGYDGFSRLTGTTSFIGDSTSPSAVNVEDGITYDATGNITALSRKGPSGAETAHLAFTYNGNQQTGGSDTVSNTSWSNTYRSDGSVMESGITGMTYADNLLGMIAQVGTQDPIFENFFDVPASYDYLPDGTKLQAIYSGHYTTLYRGAFTYRKVSAVRSLESITLPGVTIMVADTVYTPLARITDHLGNVRALVDMKTGNVVERSDYYTYGTRIIQPSDTLTSYPTYTANRWRLAAKEEQDNVTGLPYVDFSARQYDPYATNWLTIDPLAADYPGVGPYAYCAGDPVNLVDINGLYTKVKKNDDGTFTVIGGELDDDLNVYVYTLDKNGDYTIKGESIGKTTSSTTFYNSDKEVWAIDAVINLNDDSGKDFISFVVDANFPLGTYAMHALPNGLLDFKNSNGTFGSKKGLNHYRGMPIGSNNGSFIIASARDIGNMAAGYEAGIKGLSWKITRLFFDGLQTVQERKITQEKESSQNAQYFGWKQGYNKYINGASIHVK